MILKLFQIAAVGCLVGSALYAYTAKYETTRQQEEIAKLKARIQRERDAIGVARAEWQLLNHPERLQKLADRHLALLPLDASRVGSIGDIPMHQSRGDAIGKKLEILGVLAPTSTPTEKGAGEARTPAPPARPGGPR